MPGPAPKPAHLRQRSNRTATAANLPSEQDSAANEVPDLPQIWRGNAEDGSPMYMVWHPMVVEWWASVWRSPMASEYLDADVKSGLYHLAVLHNDFWTAHSLSGRLDAAVEIRLQGVRFGLSPIDRRRLQWHVEQGEQAADRTEKRRREVRKPPAGADPRGQMKVV